ncbi:hypothetical protein B566_EDAN016272 [Ephemera danica]|nr:hypothetical protein B566_EDAN016272 [Ephemera danica]
MQGIRGSNMPSNIVCSTTAAHRLCALHWPYIGRLLGAEECCGKVAGRDPVTTRRFDALVPQRREGLSPLEPVEHFRKYNKETMIKNEYCIYL